MRKLLLLFVCLGLLSTAVLGQAGNFRSRATGNWNAPGTWDRDADSNGSFEESPSTVAPSSSSGTITIQNPHTVLVTAGVTIDQTVIQSGGLLQVNLRITLTIADGTGIDLDINGGGNFQLTDDGIFDGSFLTVAGYLNNSGTITFDTNISTMTFQSGSTYEHSQNGGAIPLATWNSNSLALVTGVTDVSPTNGNQNFGRFTWNSTSQTGTRVLGLTGTKTFGGDVTLLSTGSGTLAFSVVSSTSITIAGNFTISGSAAFFLTSSSAVTLTVNGNYSNSSSGASRIQISGTGPGILNVKGNFTQSAGSLRSVAMVPASQVNFSGTGVQTLTSGGTFIDLNFTVKNGATLNIPGNNAISGTGDFTVETGGRILVGSKDAAGAIQNSTTNGNIQNSGARTYNNSTVVYDGNAINGNAAGAQTIGDGQPTGSGVTTRIDNPSGVALSASLVIVGTLILDNGNLSVGPNTLTLNGTYTPNSNSLVTAAASNISIGGPGAFGILTLTGSTIINSLVLTNTGTVTLGSDVTIGVNGNLSIDTKNIILNGHALAVNGDFTQLNGGTITADAASSLSIGGSGTLPGTISLSGSAINTITVNRTTPAVNLSPNVAATNVNLLAGTLSNAGTINIATAGLITRGNGAWAGTAPGAVSSYNVNYTNSSPISTGVELPSGTTQLANLDITGSGIVSLGSAITVNGIFTASGGFNSNSNPIDFKGNIVSNVGPSLTSSTSTFSGTTTISGSASPTFGAITITGTLTPAANLSINGNLVNNGTLNAGSSTVTFGGNTTISGSSTSSLNNILINGTLIAPSGPLNIAGTWTNNGTFTAGTGTIVFNGTSSVAGSASSNFNSITISGTLNSPATLNVGANFTNNGTFNRGTGTVVFNGSATQSISGSAVTDFNNITVSNPVNSPAVQVQSNQNLRGVLTLSGTTTVFDADGSVNTSIFRLMSSADSPTVDASIATLPTGTSVVGDVTVQRYMSIEGANNTRVYRYISSPVSGAAVSQIQSFIPVTGTFGGASSCSGCGTAQSMFAYDETVITDTNGSGIADFNDGYTNFPVSINSETLTSGRGYTLFVRGNVAPVSSNGSALWEVRGPINAGNVTPVALPVSFTSSGTPANDGWNLVGNPYPSTIDWLGSGWVKTNINDATYVLDNGLGSPVYATFIGGTGANGGSRNIAAGQAFFVKAGSASPVLTASEAVKVAGTQTTYFRTQSINDVLRIALKQGNASDETVIRFASGATGNFDKTLDAQKLNNPGTMYNMSSFGDDGNLYTINALPPLAKQDRTVKLGVNQVTPGRYTLNFSGTDTFSDNNVKISLHDIYRDTYTDIRTNASYEFEVKADAASFGNARFEIVFGVTVVTGLENTPAHISIYPNPTDGILSVEVASDNEVSAKVVDIMGSTLLEQPLQGGSVKKGTFNLQEYAEGMYILIVQDGASVYQTRIIKKR
ncbi:hypothetical protein BH09BAC3_BH09BAC3_12870 [soil metagenome]